jgi:phospholipase A1/A2
VKARLACLLCTVLSPLVFAQVPAHAPVAHEGWQLCAQQSNDPVARLACYDRWVQQQGQPPSAPVAAPPPRPEAAPGTARTQDCRSGPQSTLSRYWELEAGSDCGRFNIRGYKPISLSWVHGDSVNTAPSSAASGRTASTAQPYMRNEMRIQLSVRTKIASGLLPMLPADQRDSLWFGYTQQSYWQLFNSEISRPFRTTDHEPEIMYILPTPAGPARRLAAALQRPEPQSPVQRPDPALVAQLEPRHPDDRHRAGRPLHPHRPAVETHLGR